MGIAASLSTQTVEIGSTEVCSECNEDRTGVSRCDECGGIVCSFCCSHRPRKRNLLYGKRIDTVFVKNIADEPKQEFKRARCCCFTNDGELALVCCYYFKDNKCSCCDITSIWKLIIGDKQKTISDRLHDTETGRHPGDITLSRVKKMMFMTAPARKTVFKFSSHNQIHFAFETPGKCHGIASFDNGLAISLLIESDFNAPAWQVQFLQFDGKLKKRITVDPKEPVPLFSSPRYLSSNFSEDNLFVSDSDKHAIIALNVKGEVLFNYTDSKIRSPRGLTVDTEDNVYVADGHTVVQIEAGGHDSNALIEAGNKTEDVVDVIFESKNTSLIVIQRDGKITTFSFQI